MSSPDSLRYKLPELKVEYQKKKEVKPMKAKDIFVTEK